jgi:hypothetical protein
MALAFTILGLLVALSIPALCQLYSFLAGICTMFSWMPLIFGQGSHSGAYRLELEPVIPFVIINAPLSKFWIGWGLVVAGKKSRSCFAFILGGTNVLFAALELFYIQTSSYLTLGTGMSGLALTSLVQFLYGLSIVGEVSAGWRNEQGRRKTKSGSKLEH